MLAVLAIYCLDVITILGAVARFALSGDLRGQVR